jgi:ATP-dependent helicase/nuclease subunit B
VTGGAFPLFQRAGPRWFTIPAHRPFVEDLAAGLMAALAEGGPEALADAIVLTPTRRGARNLAEAFVRAGGGQALLLPQIRALGDLDEGEPPFEPGDLALDLEPGIGGLQRRFELAKLAAEHAPQLGFDGPVDLPAALELADALAAFLDSVQIEEIHDLSGLKTLVEGELARHWAKSADFLAIAAEAWPKRLEQLGLRDVTQRRNDLLRALCAQWRRNPPDRPLIAAGSTGSAPATADLLGVIAEAPMGAVVLPGLDLDLADDAWGQVEDAHPQGALKRLLERHHLLRADVQHWPARETPAERTRGRSRRRVVNEALRPAEATADWLHVVETLRAEGAGTGADPIAEGLDGLSLVSAKAEEEGAAVAALLLREALETPGRTAALVTPDADFSRRVTARLSRWGVSVDASAGTPLAASPVGVLMSLVARAARGGFEPATLLAVLKHALVRLGQSDVQRGAAARTLERRGLRGPRPRGWDGLAARLMLRDDTAAAISLARALRAALDLAAAPFAQGPAALPEAAAGLALSLEALAADERGRSDRLWSGADGEAAAQLLAGLMEQGAAAPPADAAGFAAAVDQLLAGQVVRTGGANHPRLRILGAIEARLVRADVLVLAGLEEGVWPAPAPTDPFLSRQMRKTLGLPPPERRIGLAAHDFAQAACAPDVTLIHCERRGGQPAVKSRWLWRLETLAAGAGVKLPERPDLLARARSLDAPIRPAPPALKPAERPAPRPPVEVRPRRMPVTRVETWVRDPYAVYAREVLKLRPLDRPDAPAEAAARGTAVHAAFEKLATEHPEVLPAGAETLFEAWLIEELEKAGLPEVAMARERALAARLGRWAVAFEAGRRSPGLKLAIEQEGLHVFDAPAGAFTVTAKADRIEVRGHLADILDFKTGMAPTRKQMESGLSPQLTLTAAILQAGGFAHGPGQPRELVYVRATGRKLAGEALVRAKDDETLEMALKALDGLKKRVASFDDPNTPYLSWTAPQFLAHRAGDYDHLARLYEWHVMGGEGEEGGE